MTDVKDLAPRPLEGLDLLYRRHALWLVNRLKRRVSAEDAADLAQETYLRIAPDAARIRHPKAFLMRVAMNLLRDEARRTRRREATHEAIAGSGVEAPVDTVLLKQLLLSMPPLYRDVFVLSRFGGMTYAEIAAAKGVSLKTIEWRMSKALAFCTQRLEE